MKDKIFMAALAIMLLIFIYMIIQHVNIEYIVIVGVLILFGFIRYVVMDYLFVKNKKKSK